MRTLPLIFMLVLLGSAEALGEANGFGPLLIQLDTLQNADGSINQILLKTLEEKLTHVVSVDSGARCIIRGRKNAPFELATLVHGICRTLKIEVVSLELEEEPHVSR